MQYNKELRKNNSGFTLVELIVTVVILALVTAPFLSSFVTASKTNLKSRRIEDANQISQDIIEKFKGYDVAEFKTKYGFGAESTDASGVRNCEATVNGGATGLLDGYDHYSAKLKMTVSNGGVGSINGQNTPFIENISKDDCAYFAKSIYKYDSFFSSADTHREVTIKTSYVAANPDDEKFIVSLQIDYVSNSGTVPDSTVTILEQKFGSVPTIYVAYKPFDSTKDKINFVNTLDWDSSDQLNRNPLQIYLVNQDGTTASGVGYGTISMGNVFVDEDGTALGNASLNSRYVTGVSPELNKTKINTNIIGSTAISRNTKNNISKTITMNKKDYLYDIEIEVFHEGKSISKYTASKNVVE